jgi:hypothetical protein
MKDLTGPGAGREQRVIAEDLGVAVRGALFVMAVNLRDRRIDIDHEILARRGPATQVPHPFQDPVRDGIELADMTERERPQERPDRRRGHHPQRQHPLRRPRPQDVDVINVSRPSDE